MDPLQLLSILAITGGIVLATLGARSLVTTPKTGPLAELYGGNEDPEVDADAGPLLAERLVAAKRRFGGLGRRFTPRGQLDKMRRNATLAGLGSGGIESILAIKAVASTSGAAIVPLVISLTGADIGGILLLSLVGGLVGFLAPDVWLTRKGRKRQAQIKRDLPETIDLLAIAVQAGMGLEAALDMVSQSIPGALGDEFYRLIQEIQLGSSRKQALQQLRQRTEVTELSSFAMALIQADAVGSPIADVLQSNASRMRLVRRQDAREMAAKLPVKLLLPMLMFIFPVLMLVIIGPAAISIIEMFKST